MLGKGRNCTELFESYHSLSGEKAHAVLEKWFVEEAKPGDADFESAFDWEPERAPFYAELRARAREFFRGRSHKVRLCSSSFFFFFFFFFF